VVAFRPLPIALVNPDWADRVVAPAHDSMSAAKRSQFRAENPDSYLNVTRSPQPGTGDTVEEMVTLGKAALDRLISLGAFGDVVERFHVYELQHGSLVQRAIVGGVDVEAYYSKQLKTHEEVHPARLELLTRHFEIVGAQSSPIALGHRYSTVVAEVIARSCDSEPMLEVTNYGLRQRVWPIAAVDATLVTDDLANEPFYVIDGHHRVGTAERYMRRNTNPAGRWAHTALFASDQLNNLAYHRVLNKMSSKTFLEKIQHLPLKRSAELPSHQAEDELLFHTGDEWLLVQVSVIRSEADPLAHLDPVVLHRQILGPIFGFGQSDSRVGYRPGEDALIDVASASTGDGILCAMRPIAIPDLLAVADAGINMPPRSTYFSPKVRSGLFLRPLVDGLIG
jgi:uncharacterized protein (DUF1015 family)